MRGLSLSRVSIGALKEVSLALKPGEIVCLSGPSGSGKSRLLRAVADLEGHTGTVSLGETNQSSVPGHQWRCSVMMVPAESAWWFETVGEHLQAPAADMRSAAKMLGELGFPEDARDWPVARLSSGEKQRLALVRALFREPRALLLDEPTANLDEDNTRNVENWLLHLIRERQLPVLWVAHREDQIRRVADRHFYLQGAALVERGTAP